MTGTGGVRRHHDLEVVLRFEELRRILGYGEGGIPPRTRAILEEVEEVGRTLIEPSCAYRILSRDELGESGFLQGVPAAAVGLVTIGGALEALVSEWRSEGQVGRALLLDALGSAAVEGAADTAEDLLRTEVEAQGLRCSRRFSPGYGGWSVTEQSWLLPAIESEALGVTAATPGWMMRPRKSTTFAVTVGRRPIELRCDGDCDECGIPGCHHRRPRRQKEARA